MIYKIELIEKTVYTGEITRIYAPYSRIGEALDGLSQMMNELKNNYYITFEDTERGTLTIIHDIIDYTELLDNY